MGGSPNGGAALRPSFSFHACPQLTVACTLLFCLGLQAYSLACELLAVMAQEPLSMRPETTVELSQVRRAGGGRGACVRGAGGAIASSAPTRLFCPQRPGSLFVPAPSSCPCWRPPSLRRCACSCCRRASTPRCCARCTACSCCCPRCAGGRGVACGCGRELGLRHCTCVFNAVARL